MVASLRTSDGELEGSEMTYYYFCHMLMVAETTLIQYGSVPGQKYQKVGIIGHHFGCCLSCRQRSWKDGEQNDGFKTGKAASNDAA